MGLHKIVNGVRIECTPEEEKKIKDEWAANKIKMEERKKRRAEEKAEKERVVEKLLSGLTEDEKKLIKPKLM